MSSDSISTRREFREPQQIFTAGELEKLVGKPLVAGQIAGADPHLAKSRVAKMAMRAADRSAREARKEWTRLRGSLAAEAVDVATAVDMEVVGRVTLNMWRAEAQFAACAATWRDVLAEREAMPVADRWSLAGLDKWARAQEAAKP
jgi:hypothetical protein